MIKLNKPTQTHANTQVLAVLCEARGTWLAKNLKEVLKQVGERSVYVCFSSVPSFSIAFVFL